MRVAAGERPVQAPCRSCRIISGGCGCREQESRRRMRSRGRSVVRPGGQPTWTNLANRGCEPQELARSRTAAAATGRTCLTSRCSSSPVISLLLLPSSSAVTSGLQEKKVLPTKKTVRSQEVQEEASPARCSSPCRRDGRGLCLTPCPPTTQSQVRRKQKKKKIPCHSDVPTQE